MIDCKKKGKVSRGKGSVKPDAILILKDEDFVALATGKLVGKASALYYSFCEKIVCLLTS